VYFVFIIIGLQFNLEGLAYAKLCAILFSSGIKFYLLKDSMQLTFLEWIVSLKKNLAAMSILILMCLMVAYALSDADPFLRLSVGMAVSFILYVLVLFLLKSEILFRVILFAKTKFLPNHKDI
jgi:hypothetical protein